MILLVVVASALLLTFVFPLVLPWTKSSAYIWLVVWFGFWLLFYISQFRSGYERQAENGLIVTALLAVFVTGSLVRLLGHGIQTLIGRRDSHKPTALAHEP